MKASEILSTVEMPESEGPFLARQFLGTDLDETVSPSPSRNEEKRAMRIRLVKIATDGGSGGFTANTKNELIDLIIGLSNCDRQNNAEVYTKFIMFLVDELGAPILEYFDEWSEWLNAWDVKI